MKRIIRDLNLTLASIDQRRIRLGLVIFSLILFVLGAGAPDDGGGGGGG